MANVTYVFNSTSEFYSGFLRNLSFAFGGGSYAGIFLWAFAVFIVHKIGGTKASVPTGTGLALLLSNAGLLPSWISPLIIMVVSLSFAILVYDRWIGRR